MVSSMKPSFERGAELIALQNRICNQRKEIERLHKVIEDNNKIITILKDANNREYRLGYEDGIKVLATTIKRYYDTLGGKTFGALVAYTIDQKTKELLDGSEKHENNGGF